MISLRVLIGLCKQPTMEKLGKSNKAIVLNGLARGGTNITWNILQSHPNILSPMGEINEVIGKRGANHLLFEFLNIFKSSFSERKTRAVLYEFKLKNLEDKSNRFKSEGITYTLDEVKNATLCLKGVVSPSPRLWDLKYSNLINRAFNECYFLYLIRDGYAVCESWMRRGISPSKAGSFYVKYADEVLKQMDLYQHSKLIKFEDILTKPFEVASELFQFTKETPYDLDSLRFKSKNTLHENGAYRPNYGELSDKYWVGKEDVNEFLVSGIDSIHKSHLSSSDIKAFEREAGSVLSYFNYHL